MTRVRRPLVLWLYVGLATGCAQTAVAVVPDAGEASAQYDVELALPLREGSVRFAVIGDSGTGDAVQYEVAEQLVGAHLKFPYTFVIMLGDNLYGSERPQDYSRKFEQPYRTLLEGGVEFHAALGNHDDQNQRFYEPFGMDGRNYYSYEKGNVKFFVLDSNYMDPEQLQWVEAELKSSGSEWKIPYFHHPLYASGRHGSQVDLRDLLEPLFIAHGVDVVFAGHEHFYERVKPQHDIHYFVSGGAAKLRAGDIEALGLTEVGFDTDRSFMLIEIAGDDLFFQTISRTGRTVDAGQLRRRETAPAGTTETAAAHASARRGGSTVVGEPVTAADGPQGR